MRWRAGQLALAIGAIGISAEALAQSQPTPRPPLGPSDTGRQVPAGLQGPPLAADAITVSNLGTTVLQFSSWDGEKNWTSFQIAPRQTITITCARCASEIPIAFHDGSENRTTNARTADRYGFFWNDAQSRWDLASIATIMRTQGVFR